MNIKDSMKTSSGIHNCILPLLVAMPLSAAPFQNLDFEATMLPSNGSPSLQPITVALPGWRAFIGPNEQSSVLFNDLTVGGAFVGVSGTAFPVLEGNFSVLLFPGAGSEAGGVTLSQTGTIPDDAQSLRFLGSGRTDLFGVFINGQQVQVTDAFSEPGLYNFSADISAFAGQDGTLSFTAFRPSQALNSLFLDSISFSPVPVPEPSTLALFIVATFLGCFYRQKRQR